MVNNTKNIKIKISIKAKNGLCIQKNRNDQKKFANNWPAKTNKSVLVCFGFVQIRYNDIAIKVNNKVQTGAKIQFGGLKNGFCNVAYQPLIDGMVTSEPKQETP